MSSIYQAPNKHVAILYSGQSVDDFLDWTARTLIIDNYTNAYLFIPPIMRYFRPGAIGVIVPLPPSNRVTANFAAPAGVIQGPLNDGTSATLTYLAEPMPAQSGTIIAPANTSSNTIIVRQGSTSGNVVVPFGSLYVTVQLSVVPVGNSTWQLIGVQSNYTYGGYFSTDVVPSGGSITRIYKLNPLDTTLSLQNQIGSADLTGTFLFSNDTNGPIQEGKPTPPDWQVNVTNNTNGVVTTVASGSIAGATTVLDKAIYAITANAGRVFGARVWDGASGGTRIGIAAIGNNAAAGIGSQWVPIERRKSSPGNTLTFDIDFSVATGEIHTISASGWFV